jgi:hypothetical protein
LNADEKQLDSVDEPNSNEDENEDLEEEPLEGVENIPLKASRKRKAYTVGFKLEAIKYAKTASIHKASGKFNVDRTNIRNWISQEKKLMLLKYFFFFYHTYNISFTEIKSVISERQEHEAITW